VVLYAQNVVGGNDKDMIRLQRGGCGDFGHHHVSAPAEYGSQMAFPVALEMQNNHKGHTGAGGHQTRGNINGIRWQNTCFYLLLSTLLCLIIVNKVKNQKADGV